MERAIEEIINDLEDDSRSHPTQLNSLDAANYLNSQLLQQIDILRNDNEQVCH